MTLIRIPALRMLAVVLALLSLPTRGVSAAEVAGVKFDEQAAVGKGATTLNGFGLRRILFFKAYAIGLYLPQKHDNTNELLADHGAKRIRIVLLRDLTAEQITDTLEKGMRRNLTDAEFLTLASRIDRLRSAIQQIGSAPSGSSIHLDWLPDEDGGITRLVVNSQSRGEAIAGEDFFHALLKIWLGESVNDPKLRDALLGRAS